MKATKVVPITKPVRLTLTGKTVHLSPDIRAIIETDWQQRVRSNPSLYNGEAFTIVAQRETQDAWEFDLAITDFAHVVYNRAFGGLGKYAAKIIHPAA